MDLNKRGNDSVSDFLLIVKSLSSMGIFVISQVKLLADKVFSYGSLWSSLTDLGVNVAVKLINPL